MSSFHERQKSLFETLKSAEEECGFSKTNKASENQDFGTIDRHNYRKLKREMKQFRGKESIYKRGEANIKQCLRAKTIPDYMKNPQKWVYYSLADVTPEQMSDRTNTATALALMKQLEEKESQDTIAEVTDETGAVFKKPTFKISKTIKQPTEVIESPAEENSVVFKSNKIVMPEYVVGVTKKKDKPKVKKTPKDESAKSTLVLNHLYDDNDEDDYAK
ncbi:protein TSSC4 [Aricia agestis]|uniref:protein TSSC4 n=1 Tax=Aricia agestis TaxID=91739 RepID=UPI001C2068BF|nr:protein TSSC4 [Aricia agestis]